MSANKRFFPIENINSVFIFKINTNHINTGATDGSENPLTFKLPLREYFGAGTPYNFIIRVNDGRPDYAFGAWSTPADFTLHFSTAGEYIITIFGDVVGVNYDRWGSGIDRLKITEILQWGNFYFGTRAFNGCVNLVVNAYNTLVLPSSPSYFFQGIKEIRSPMNLINTEKAVDMGLFLSGIQTPLKSTLNPFFKSLITVTGLYSVSFTADVEGIEIISDSVQSLSQPWNSLVTPRAFGDFYLRIKTPNLKTMFRVFYGASHARTKCHAGEIDVRNVTNTDQWLSSGNFTTVQVDATLLGWANNLPYMQSGVTWDWYGSKYSNNPAVIAALNKITNDWGVIFTNLTMA